ncbi:unnamed protein product, partial [Phaeothamnion confervicola]
LATTLFGSCGGSQPMPPAARMATKLSGGAFSSDGVCCSSAVTQAMSLQAVSPRPGCRRSGGCGFGARAKRASRSQSCFGWVASRAGGRTRGSFPPRVLAVFFLSCILASAGFKKYRYPPVYVRIASTSLLGNFFCRGIRRQDPKIPSTEKNVAPLLPHWRLP